MRKNRKKILAVFLIIIAVAAVVLLLNRKGTESFEEKYAGADLDTDVAGMERTGTYTGYLNEHADFIALVAAKTVTKEHIYLFAHHSRAVIDNMIKRLKLAVKITHKMLGALWKIQNRTEIDYLARKRAHCRIFFGKQFKIFDILLHFIHFSFR